MVAFLLAGCGGAGGNGGNGGGQGGGGGKESVLAKYDFSSLTELGTEIASADDATTLINGCKTEGSATVTVTEATKIANGNSSGGIGSASGLLKFGSGKVNGVLEFTVSKAFKKAVINCHSFYKSSESYPTNTTNYFAVNDGTAQAAPYNENATGEDVTFTISGTTLKIETSNPNPTSTTTAGRIIVYGITLYA